MKTGNLLLFFYLIFNFICGKYRNACFIYYIILGGKDLCVFFVVIFLLLAVVVEDIVFLFWFFSFWGGGLCFYCWCLFFYDQWIFGVFFVVVLAFCCY